MAHQSVLCSPPPPHKHTQHLLYHCLTALQLCTKAGSQNLEICVQMEAELWFCTNQLNVGLKANNIHALHSFSISSKI